jgi:RimJ/RimL family protein N-acetyltransferase
LFSLLLQSDARPPFNLAWAWIIDDLQGQPIGLIELADLDFHHQSTQLMLGMARHDDHASALEAGALMLAVLLHHLGLKKVRAKVCADDVNAQAMLAASGFVCEATLPDNVLCQFTGEAVTVIVCGLLCDETLGNPTWVNQGRRIAGPAFPDLVHDQLPQLLAEATGRLPWWQVFPPLVAPADANAIPALPQQAVFEEHRIWHDTLPLQRYQLAPPAEKHRDSLRQWFTDKHFTLRYARHKTGSEAEIDAMLAERKGPTHDTGLIWVVEDRISGLPLGLLGLVHLDATLRSGELTLGFPDPDVPGRAVYETAAMALSLAFHYLQLRQLNSMVYADNHHAQLMTVKMGFQHCGRLRSELAFDRTGARLDVWINRYHRDAFTARCQDKFTQRLSGNRYPALFDESPLSRHSGHKRWDKA